MKHDVKECIHKLRKDTHSAAKFFAKKLSYTLGPVELKEKIEKGMVKVIDVRNHEDYNEGHIVSAISIPKDMLVEKLHTLSKEDLHVVYCYNQQCHLGAVAAFILADAGYPVMDLEGGFDVWANVFKFDVVK